MANPKCRYCGKEIKDKKSAVKILVGTKNAYYCNRDEYRLATEIKNAEKAKDKEFIDEIELLIDMYINIENKSSWDSIEKDFLALSKTYPREHIFQYLSSEIDRYSEIVNKKRFDTEYGKVRYFIAIVKNNIEEYVRNHPLIKDEPSLRDVDFYMAPINYSPDKPRRAMVDIEEGDDE